MADEDVAFSRDELLRRIRNGWNDFNVYLKSLSEEQLTQPTDAAGWTAKDHVAHLAVWEDGIDALLAHEDRLARMGITREVWEQGDDAINAVIQAKYRDMPLIDVMSMFENVHARLVVRIQSMTTEDLERPYRDYDPTYEKDTMVWPYIIGNSYGHYEEHQPWIDAIIHRAE